MCLFDNWILQQRDRQDGLRGHTHTHTQYCGTGTASESSEYPVIYFKVGGRKFS